MLVIDKSWTLFLDRDGVLNHEKDLNYVKHESELKLYKGITSALAICTQLFGRIIVVTNQKGIGKKLMTERDLEKIHALLLESVMEDGGYIDAFYHAPDLDNDAPMRKPQTGMALAAKKDFPETDFSKSIMVGNNISDMQFGKSAGMHTVFVTTTQSFPPEAAPLADFVFTDLPSFTEFLTRWNAVC